jgi:hypothetical protein
VIKIAKRAAVANDSYIFPKNTFIGKLSSLLLLFFVFYSGCLLSQEESDTPKLKVDLGGALRFNYNNSSWKPNQQKKGGDFGFEVFRLEADVTYAGNIRLLNQDREVFALDDFSLPVNELNTAEGVFIVKDKNNKPELGILKDSILDFGKDRESLFFYVLRD